MDLIPGLPDDIARECLIRVPYDRFSAVRSVCKLWNHELDSPSFHQLRKLTGLTRAAVALAQAEPTLSQTGPAKKYATSTPAYRLVLLEPDTGTWHSIPPIPGLHHGLPLFCQIAGAGRSLVVVGGWDPESWAPSNEVFVYDFVSATWHRGALMPDPRRSFFACASDADRTVFVAGGHNKEKNALRSALAYDVVRDEWAPMPDMARERDECRGVFRRGRFHVIGGYPTEMQGRFGKSEEVFDADTWEWGPVEDTLEAGTCPRTCVAGSDGKMYMCMGSHVAVLEEGTWHGVVELPEEASVVTQVVAAEGKVVVMGSGCHGGPQVVYAMELSERKEKRWRKVEVPEEYSGHVQGGCYLEI